MFGSFDNCLKHLTKENNDYKPLMLMNLGIFDIYQKPLGLYYSNGLKLHHINISKGTGNFYSQPNGIFIIEKSGVSKIFTTKDFMKDQNETLEINNAIQSGPMLVIEDIINKEFDKNSKKLFTRNGVGIMNDGNNVFVISKQAISLFEFANVFRINFKCKNVLYLDGAISKMYAPKLQLNNKGGNFATIIAIGEK